MQLLSLLPIITFGTITTAAPVGSVAPTNGSSPCRCGFVRFDVEPGNFILGVTVSDTCERLDYQQNLPTIYRIDQPSCGCDFYTTLEDCENKDFVPAFVGPRTEEARIPGPSPSFARCRMLNDGRK